MKQLTILELYRTVLDQCDMNRRDVEMKLMWRVLDALKISDEVIETFISFKQSQQKIDE